MKRARAVLNSLLSLVLVLGLMPLPAYADDTSPESLGTSEVSTFDLSLSGSGTADDPYQIGSAEDLAAFRDAVNAGSNSICGQLTDDIELTETWTAIGNAVKTAYAGTFDGANHTISGLSIVKGVSGSQGFFGQVKGASIKNLKVSGSVDVTVTNTGGIAGSAVSTTFTNCSFSGFVKSANISSSRVGAIAGSVTDGACTFIGCANMATVYGAQVGGIVGYSNQGNTFQDCYNAGAITGKKRAAGIAGQSGATDSIGSYINCFNVGEISTDGTNYAGIVSFYNGTPSSDSVSNCYYTSPATAYVNSSGGGTVFGTKVDSMAGMAETLGSAFVEGTDYPTLAWENVVSTPKATVAFEITPADATLTINGKGASATSKRAAGTYTYTVSKQGYNSASGEFTVTEEQAAASETITINVELVAKELEIITVAGAAEQYYVGDEQPELTVTAHYADGTSEEVTGFTTDWDSSTEAANKVITVNYGGKTATFTCNFVIKPGPTSGLTSKADVELKVGTYGWEEVELDGTTVLASTNKGKGSSSSTMTITAKQAGMLSFNWKVSSESGYDWLDIKVNNTSTTSNKASRSGTIDWTAFSATVSVGDVISINYTKDYSGDRNEDAAWVKDFAFAPTYTVNLSTTPANATVVLKDASGQTVAGKAGIDGVNSVYTLVDGTYSYTASAFGYETAQGTFEVNGANVEHAIALTALPTKTVSFTITAPDGLSAADATLVVKNGNTTMTAQADGGYALPAGDYTYTVSHPNCEEVSGTFTVADQDVNIPITLVRKWVISDYFEAAGVAVAAANDTYGFVLDDTDSAVLKSNNQKKGSSTAKLTLTAKQSGLIAFAYKVSSETRYDKFNVKANSTSVVTDKSGEVDWTEASMLVSAGDVITFTYTKDGSGDSNDDSVWLKNFSLQPAYTTTFTVVPADASVVVKDAAGQAVSGKDNAYTLVNGTYSYEVSAFGYETAQGSFEVNGANVERSITLNALPTCTVGFSIPEGASASVSHATAGTMAANEDGTYTLPVGEDFTYTVTKDNYLTVSGTFTAAQNDTISVEMEYAGAAWDGTTKTEPSQVEGVYQISNAAELAWFANKVTEENTVSAVLTDQINLNGKTWTSMGKLNPESYQNEFAGTFDGAGHTVSGLKAANGLFAATASTGVVKNLIVSGDIQGSGNIGGIVGTHTGLIENCLFKGTIKNSSTYATGGIAGRCQSSNDTVGAIKNCVNQADISFAGSLYSTTGINMGGIVGYTYGEVSNCYNVGTISGNANYALGMGGIAGSARASSTSGNANIVNCYNAGTLTNFYSADALVGTIGTGAIISNSYYLNTCGATSAQAQGKTKAEMTAPAFVGFLNDVDGTQWRIDSASINGGMPVLQWQGGTEYNNQDAKDVATARAALKLQAVANGETVDLEANNGVYSLEPGQATALVLPAEGAAETVITWEIIATGATHESAIAENGAITYPTSATDTYTLTATITKGDATASTAFAVTLLSPAQVAENELAAITAKVDGRSLWAFQVNDPSLTTASDVVKSTLAKQGINLDEEGITLTFTSAGTKAYPVTDDVNLAADGTISYFQGVEGNTSAKYAQYSDVAFTLSRDGVSKAFTIRLFIGWDRATVQDKLNAAALAMTWDSIKPEGVNNQVEYADTNGEAQPGEPVYPTWFVKCDGTDIETGEENANNVAVPDGTVFMLPANVGATSVRWEANYDENAGQLVTFEETYVNGNRMWKATLNGSAYDTYELELNAIYTYNLFNDGEGTITDYQYRENPDTHQSELVVDENGNPVTVEVPTVTTYASIYLTLAQGEQTPIDADQTQSDLESKYEGLITDFYDKTTKPNLGAVADDLQMPTPSDLEKAGILQLRDFEKVTMTSGDAEHLDFYGYHAQVYRPLPGMNDVRVPYTITITDRYTNQVYAQHTFYMTLSAFDQVELDAAQALMTRVATEEVYWNGLAYEGANKNNITQNLQPFSEITADAEGNLTYIRGAVNMTLAGIELDDLPGYDPMNYGQSWREIRSSSEDVIASETLLFTQPKYNTEVTLDSVMTYSKYAKYWEKFGIGEAATAESAGTYAAFKNFYKVPVSTTVKAAGTDGDKPTDPAPDVNVTLTVSLAGSLATTSQNAVAAALPVVAKDTNVDGTVSYAEALAAAHEAYASNGADDFAISDTGWVTKLWGVSTDSAGFLLNNASTSDVISKIAVTDGDALYVYTYTDAANYSDAVASFDTTSVTANTGEGFEVTLNYSGYDSNWNAETGVVAGAQIGYATPNGFVPLDGVVTDAAGKANVTFDQAGTYVLTAQSASKVITAPFSVVTVTYVPHFAVSAQPFAGAYMKVTLPAAGVAENTTPVAAGVSFVQMADGSFAALMTTDQAAELNAGSFTFTEGAAAQVGALGDVNGSGVMNIVDAQIAYDLANNRYADFSRVPMAQWLAADMNSDNVIDAADAFAIQYAVHYGRS